MRNFKILICAIMICTCLTGCMNQANLKDLVVIEGIAIDNKDDKIKLTLQSLNVDTSSGVDKPEGNMTINTSGEGNTIIDAVDKLSTILSKELFFGHNKLIIFSKDVCQTDLKKKLDYFLRSTDSRPDVAICMSNSSASKILENNENDAHIPVEEIVYLINNGQKNGHSIYITTEELLNIYTDKTSDIYMPVIKEHEDSKTAELGGIAIFSNDTLAYTLDDDETTGFVLISNKIKNCLIELNDEKLGKIGVEISTPEVSKNVSVTDGTVYFNVNVTAKLMIYEVQNGIASSLNEDDLKRICENAEKTLTSFCEKAFSACQSHNSDALRVGEYLAKDNLVSYNLLADNWDSYYKSVRFSCKTSIKLKKISDNTQLNS